MTAADLREAAVSDAAAAAVGLDPADWAMWRGISDLRNRLERRLEMRLQHDASISAADFDVLRALAQADGHRMRAGGLADALGWEKSRISHQVSRMTARGLVDRAGCPTDGRGTWVVLAAAGADVFAKAACGYAEVLKESFFGVVSADERAVIQGVADRVAIA